MEYKHKRDTCFAVGMACLALCEWGIALVRAYPVSDAPFNVIGISVFTFAIPAAIAAFAMGLNHFTLSKGYGDGWTLTAILLIAFAICTYSFNVPSRISEEWGDGAVIGSWEAMPPLCFGLGALLIGILPRRRPHIK